MSADEGTLRETFGDLTLRRARDYAVAGQVDKLGAYLLGDGHVGLGAQVGGTALIPYDTFVTLRPTRDGRVEIEGECDCPVGEDCKHAAAVLLVARRGLAPAQPVWERQLGEMLDDLDRAEPVTTGRKVLALQFDLEQPGALRSRQQSTPTVRLRPLGQGAKDNWIKTGVGWSELQYLGYRGTHDPAQVTVLAELATVVSRGPGGTAYYSSTLHPSLGACAPTIWPLLRRAQESGVALLAGGGLSGVELSDRPVELAVDVVGDGEAGAHLRPVARDGERVWSGQDLLVQGQPGHGVALLRRDPAEGRGQPRVHLTLAPLARLVTEPMQRLFEGQEAVHVPAGGRGALVTDYLPRLRRHLPVTSSDGSVDIPEESPPELVLSVGWPAVDRAQLAWSWRYRTGEQLRSFPLGSADGLRTVRRPAAERDHLAALDLDGADPGAARLLRDPHGALLPAQELTGSAAIGFAEEVLPVLVDHPAVTVEVDGETPSFRAAEGPAEIRFDLAGEDPPGSDLQPEEDRATDWLDLAVSIAVDGQQIPLATVVEALTLGRDRIVLPSGLYLTTDRPELARLADLVRSASELVEQQPERLRVGRHDLGLWGELAQLGVVDAQAEQWVRAARALQTLTELPEVEPTGLKAELRSYQLEGFRWLAFLWQAGLGGILADDMGLGKTLQTLALIAHARERGAGPFLVVAPTSVVSGWVREAGEHAPGLDVRAVTASLARRHQPLEAVVEGADVVVTSYTLFRLEADEYAAQGWGGLVLDEAQQIKNHQGKTYAAVRRLDVPFRLALSGTPFENRLMELWSLLSVVAPGLYPWPTKFAELVAHPVERRGDRLALERFRRRIRPFLLRRTKELVAADLPPKQEQVLEVTLGSRHRRVYDTVLQRERQHVLGLVDDFDRNRIAIFRALTRLRQLSLDAALVDPEYDGLGSAKLDVLVEHLVELAGEGHRALVFSQFTGFLARVRDRLDREGIDYAYLDGQTRNRPSVIEGFRRGSQPVFLISLKAGGVGLTLTEADYVFVLDPWWNPAVEAQAVDRAHRIGQTRPVLVYRLVAGDTIEEKVMALKERKAELFSRVVDGDGAMATAVGAEDVRALFDG